MNKEPTLHASSVVFCGRGILIRGPSGSGKSDLVLRIIDSGGMLVSDDRSVLNVESNALYASPPKTIAGLLEIRGIGLKRLPHLAKTRIDLCIDCVNQEETTRMPEKREAQIHGITLPCLRLYPFEVSSVAKIRAFLQYPSAHD